jgi:hypothetical protein
MQHAHIPEVVPTFEHVTSVAPARIWIPVFSSIVLLAILSVPFIFAGIFILWTIKLQMTDVNAVL